MRRTCTASSMVGLSFVIAAIVLWLGLQSPAEAAAVSTSQPSGAQVYAERCASCHQPQGEGVVGTFPPLLANASAADAEYVTAVIEDGLTEPLEIDGVVYTTPMPPVAGISAEETAAVTDYVVELAGRSAAPTTTTPTEPEPATPPSAARGKDLFTGATRFENGGGACSSCHTAGSVGNLGGSGLGPDLSTAHTRLGGDVGIDAWLTNPPSVTMAPLFANKPLTAEERAHLAAFLAVAETEDRPGGPDVLLIAGLGGVAALIGGMAVAWRGMRQTYLSRLSRPRSNR